ncbi:MAG TPA: FHA domain-containing protein, partial [Actinotalea sp.]|nr:FHA domain-containing protein [Actinotalea sp.]
LAASVWVPVAEGADPPPAGDRSSTARRAAVPVLTKTTSPEAVGVEPVSALQPAPGVVEAVPGANGTATAAHAAPTAPEITLAGPDEEAAAGVRPTSGAEVPAPRGAHSLESTITEAPEGSFDYLWGATRMTTVEDAAVREAEEDHEAQHGVAAAARPGVAPDAPSSARAAVPPPAGPRITSVPGMTDPFADDHDGETILSSELAAIRAQRASGGSVPPGAAPVSGPSVLARVCPDGHANPPQSAQCRVCGTALEVDAVRVARPRLGRVRLSTGESLDLDSPVVLGRSPRVGRVAGPDVPRPVVVPSPTREISGTHLAIRLEEWHVLVADLDSSNGTVLRRPGQPPQRLQPREQVLVRTGDVVDLGDGVVLTFEDLP